MVSLKRKYIADIYVVEDDWLILKGLSSNLLAEFVEYEQFAS